jgi:hypothetical protein
MASHYSSLGMSIESEAELIAFAEAVGPLAEGVVCNEGTYFHWHDASGAELWLQVNRDNEFLGMLPHFAGESRLIVRLVSRIHTSDRSPMDGSFYGWIDSVGAIEDTEPAEESGLYPFVFDSPEFARLAPLELPITLPMQIAAIAHEIEIHADEAAFAASQTGEVKLEPRSFIPSGLYHPDGTEATLPEARAIITGRVLKGERRLNTYTNQAFYTALLETYGGEYDVAIDTSLLSSVPQPGNILSGSFWLTGRVILD